MGLLTILIDFYLFFKTASWICTLCWMLLVISGIIRFVRDRRHQIRTRQDLDHGAIIEEEIDTEAHHEALSKVVEESSSDTTSKMYDPLPVLEGAMRNPLPWFETMWKIVNV